MTAPATTNTAIPLTSQVGGHAGVLSSEDGSLVIKPCLPLEKAFYEALPTSEVFNPLIKLVPKFYGILKLAGKVEGTAAETLGEAKGEELVGVGKDESNNARDRQASGSRPDFNLSHTFKKPNILDIKLGTILYDDDASPEKKVRMEKTAKETTSFETGVRLTGFQVYDQSSDAFVNTPKSYGKSIKVADLPEGIAKFFPVASPSGETGITGGVDAKLLVPVLDGVIAQVRRIRDVLSKMEMRMVGGSILIIWEGEEAALKASVEAAASAAEDAEGETDSDEDDSDASGAAKIGPPYLVRLIDFAHTKAVVGKGPDEGVLLGLETSLRLLEARRKEIAI